MHCGASMEHNRVGMGDGVTWRGGVTEEVLSPSLIMSTNEEAHQHA